MTTPLRIAMVSARFFPYSGGVEIHTREISKRLAAAGHAVTVLTTDPSGTLAAAEDLDGFQVRRVRAWPANSDLYFSPLLYRALQRGHWDIMHVQGYHTLVPPMAMLGGLRAGLPYVVTFHGGGHSSRLRQAVRGTQRQLLAPLLRRADRLIALAEFEMDLFGDRLGIPRTRFSLIPTGTDLPAVETPVAPANETIIASIGRLERYKGHHRVLAAMPAILRQQPDARLWIAGSGPYEAELRRQAQALGVADRVDIRAIASTDRQAMASEVARVSLVTLLSDYETQPAAVLEGLALGRPALVADTSGLSEIARRGMARAIPVDSPPEQVAAAVIQQLREPLLPAEVRLPTWDDCAANLEQLYLSVVAARGRRRSGAAPRPHGV